MTAPTADFSNHPQSRQSSAWAEEPGAATLSLLNALEASLQSSQAMLLALDLPGIEACAAEQSRLTRALGIFLGIPVSSPHNIRSHDPQPLFLGCSAPLQQKLRDAAQRIVELTRLQAALLRRSQSFLSMLANASTDPEANYHPNIRRWPGTVRQAS